MTTTEVPRRDDTGPADLEAAIAAAQAGSQAAFAALYRDTQPRLLRYATSLVGQDAEDVTAEAWLQIARDIRRFQGDVSAFRGWTATIVRHRAMDHLRAANRRPATPVETLTLDRPGGDDIEQSVLETLSTESALAMIMSLPPDQAEAVLLRAVVGLDAVSAARVLGKRPGAVRVAAHRGLRTLARRLERNRE
jgi:RNA polymerase sigma-70 factor (ECF subfamily)